MRGATVTSDKEFSSLIGAHHGGFMFVNQVISPLEDSSNIATSSPANLANAPQVIGRHLDTMGKSV